MEILGIWIAAFLTLCIYSCLYRDNPFYRFAEHLFVGISVGYGIVIAFHQGFLPLAWTPLWEALSGESYAGFVKIIPICIGLLFFARLSPRHAWLVSYPIAIFIGFTSGAQIPNVLQAAIFEQTRGTIEPFAAMHAGTIPPEDFLGVVIGAILMVVGVTCTLTYFFFSVEHRGPINWFSKVGIAFLMIGFGAAFGNTVMGRAALLIHRVGFLINDWFGTIF